MTRVVLLTPPGTAAIAVLAVTGPRAWELTQALFRPAGKPLPAEASLGAHRFGRIGNGAGDEVMLFVPQTDHVEIHCHGGRQVVRWLTNAFVQAGAVEAAAEREADAVEWLLSQAPTLRWASILLDQRNGAYHSKIEAIRNSGNLGDAQADLERMLTFAPIARHLASPFTVGLIGPPNVGKSSLMNALTGYERSIVSATAGTTRDLVTQELAFDGVPIRLIDTAGIRDDADALESEGVARSRRTSIEVDLVLQLYEAGSPRPQPLPKGLLVQTKIDLGACSSAELGISSVTGEGLAELTATVVRSLVPVFPESGEAVPTSEADLIELAARLEKIKHQAKPVS